jgi:hypothetical protein
MPAEVDSFFDAVKFPGVLFGQESFSSTGLVGGSEYRQSFYPRANHHHSTLYKNERKLTLFATAKLSMCSRIYGENNSFSGRLH